MTQDLQHAADKAEDCGIVSCKGRGGRGKEEKKKGRAEQAREASNRAELDRGQGLRQARSSPVFPLSILQRRDKNNSQKI